MNLFDQLVNEALGHQPTLSSLRLVVEKELLHHDILRILSKNDLLTNLTFIGGTCLRTCYGGIRLSEDLDFTGGDDFSRETLQNLGDILTQNLKEKYGLNVKVTEPLRETGNVDTWKISIETRPQRKDFPAQRINIDVCSVPSYERIPMLLLNPYGVDMGTSGLIIQAESREEIYADKVVALGLRPNRIKNRDLWDISWLHQQGLKPRFELIAKKLNDRTCSLDKFLSLYTARRESLERDPQLSRELVQEMQRFLPVEQINNINMIDWLKFIVYLLGDIENQFVKYLNAL